jgi:hypothetical protein
MHPVSKWIFDSRSGYGDLCKKGVKWSLAIRADRDDFCRGAFILAKNTISFPLTISKKWKANFFSKNIIFEEK